MVRWSDKLAIDAAAVGPTEGEVATMDHAEAELLIERAVRSWEAVVSSSSCIANSTTVLDTKRLELALLVHNSAILNAMTIKK